jgi:hypothetical protein
MTHIEICGIKIGLKRKIEEYIMAVWSVKPEWKKSIIERQYWSKPGSAGHITYEIGWRWGEFHVTTDDDNPPEIEAGVDIYSCGYESELVECTDGCWEESEIDVPDEEERARLEEFLEENSILDLEEEGWVNDETEMIIDCDLIIEKVSDE